MSIRATFHYFQGLECDMYSFYRIPKLLFTSEYFKNLSCEAKVLYGAVRTGIQSADPQLLEMTKVFRLPLGRRLRAVWLPAVLPAFRQGCSVALGICWKSGVAAEVIGLPNGSIGDALYRAKITLSTGELFAWTFVIILLSAGFEKLFLLLLDCVTRAVTGEVPQC